MQHIIAIGDTTWEIVTAPEGLPLVRARLQLAHSSDGTRVDLMSDGTLEIVCLPGLLVIPAELLVLFLNAVPAEELRK